MAEPIWTIYTAFDSLQLVDWWIFFCLAISFTYREIFDPKPVQKVKILVFGDFLAKYNFDGILLLGPAFVSGKHVF